MFLSVFIIAVNFLMTIFATYLVDRVGRKILLISGMYVMLGALALLSPVLLGLNNNTQAQGGLAVLAVLIYVIGFAIGLGAVCWVIMTEVIPDRLRVKAIALFLNVSWACNLVISMVTLPAIDALGGVTSDMDDDATQAAEKKGVAYLYFIFLGKHELSMRGCIK
jgi:SP family arabinose:H+ symporter-like MFS transporter